MAHIDSLFGNRSIVGEQNDEGKFVLGEKQVLESL